MVTYGYITVQVKQIFFRGTVRKSGVRRVVISITVICGADLIMKFHYIF